MKLSWAENIFVGLGFFLFSLLYFFLRPIFFFISVHMFNSEYSVIKPNLLSLKMSSNKATKRKASGQLIAAAIPSSSKLGAQKRKQLKTMTITIPTAASTMRNVPSSPRVLLSTMTSIVTTPHIIPVNELIKPNLSIPSTTLQKKTTTANTLSTTLPTTPSNTVAKTLTALVDKSLDSDKNNDNDGDHLDPSPPIYTAPISFSLAASSSSPLSSSKSPSISISSSSLRSSIITTTANNIIPDELDGVEKQRRESNLLNSSNSSDVSSKSLLSTTTTTITPASCFIHLDTYIKVIKDKFAQYELTIRGLRTLTTASSIKIANLLGEMDKSKQQNEELKREINQHSNTVNDWSSKYSILEKKYEELKLDVEVTHTHNKELWQKNDKLQYMYNELEKKYNHNREQQRVEKYNHRACVNNNYQHFGAAFQVSAPQINDFLQQRCKQEYHHTNNNNNTMRQPLPLQPTPPLSYHSSYQTMTSAPNALLHTSIIPQHYYHHHAIQIPPSSHHLSSHLPPAHVPPTHLSPEQRW